jgi:YVTN family beta-propeller protein
MLPYHGVANTEFKVCGAKTAARLTIGEVALPSIHLPQHGPISSFPNWVTFTPDSKTLYVSNSNMNSISAIDTKLMQLVALIPVGTMPRRINTLVIPNCAHAAAWPRAGPVSRSGVKGVSDLQHRSANRGGTCRHKLININAVHRSSPRITPVVCNRAKTPQFSKCN